MPRPLPLMVLLEMVPPYTLLMPIVALAVITLLSTVLTLRRPYSWLLMMLSVTLPLPYRVSHWMPMNPLLSTTLSMNPAWLHLDFDYAANETQFQQPLVNSMLTLAMVVGISVHETTLGTTVANLGFAEITFPAPMFHGDTLRVETEVLEARESSSRPGQGVVKFEHRAYKQTGDLVCKAVRSALMLSKPD